MNPVNQLMTIASIAMLVMPIGACTMANSRSTRTTFEQEDALFLQAQEMQCQSLNQAGKPIRYALPKSPYPMSIGSSGQPLKGQHFYASSHVLLLAGSIDAKHAVVLIGGIHDSYRYFNSWIPLLTQPDTMVLGWDHDTQSMNMAASANLLAQDLLQLNDRGITSITLIAHSIGGLIAKGAVDTLSRTKHAALFQHIDLDTFGTPWGGFAILDIAMIVPGSAIISRMFGYPMAAELMPGSDYLTSLAQAMPSNGTMHVYVGNKDNIALPLVFASRQRYERNEGNAATVTIIDNLTHDSYHQALPLVELMQQQAFNSNSPAPLSHFVILRSECSIRMPVLTQTAMKH
jgi:hypothetical protein